MMHTTFLIPILFALFFIAVHYLVYRRIILSMQIGLRSKYFLRLFLIFNFFGIMGYVLTRYYINVPQWLYFILSLSIGVGFTLVIGLVLYETLHLFLRFMPMDEGRRDFFKRSSDIGFLSLGAAYVGSGVAEGSKMPKVLHINAHQGRFATPYRIAQLSDMHIGGLIEQEFVRRSVTLVNDLHPDLVVITGDLVDAPVAQLKAAVDELKNLKSRFGTFFVVGNHEYFHDIEATITYLKSIGITVLENENTLIDNAFHICGVYDLFGIRYGSLKPDITKAYEGVPKEMPTLLLAHQPSYINLLKGFEPSLILSGHTHGGQIWPLGYVVRLIQPYLKGLHLIGEKRHIYVNSGIGFWGPPMRLGSHSEITLINWS